MYALMILDTTSKVDQCTARLFLVSATPLFGGLFYYKGTIKHHFEMTRFMELLKLSEPVTLVPTGDDVKTPSQQRIQSTQR